MFERQKFDKALLDVAVHYSSAAPTVEEFCDKLCSASDIDITLADVRVLEQLNDERPDGNAAANLVFHHAKRRGWDTTGQAGF